MEKERPLHPDDIVAKKADLKQLGVIERTPGDISTHIPAPARTEPEPITHDRSISTSAWRRFLKDGIPPSTPADTVLVRWRDEAKLELLPTSRLTLVDRSLLVGDIVKRGPSDAMSGCIINTFTRCTLQPVCNVTYQNNATYKGILPPGKWQPASGSWALLPPQPKVLVDVPASELKYADTLTEEDLVIFKDWIGKVDAITNNITLKLADSSVVEIADEDGEHVDGAIGSFCVGDIAKTKKGSLRVGRWIFGQYNPNTLPIGTVVSIRTVGAEVAWITQRIGSNSTQEPPFLLEGEELDSPDFYVYDRSRRRPSGPEAEQNTVSNSEIDVRLNLRVRFRDVAGARVKYTASRSPNELPIFSDRQDHLGYDLNVFDVIDFRTSVTVQWQDLTITREESTDLIPDGSIDDEHAAWPGEVAHTLALKDVPGFEGVVQPDHVGVIQSVNAAERMARVRWSSDSFIRYAKAPEEEGYPAGIIAHRISPSSPSEEEISLYDIEAPASLNVRRGDIVQILPADFNNMQGQQTDRNWLGEIVDTRLDGTFVVRLGAASQVKDVVLRREQTVVAVRSDGTGQMDGWQENGMGEDSDEDDLSEDYDETDDEWGSQDDSEEESAGATYEDENGDLMDVDEVENEEWESADEDHNEDDDDNLQEHQTPPTSHAATPVHSSASTTGDPPSYAVLEGEVPLDHRYRNEPATTTSSHMKRTQKEHKILRSSLPDGVYIRTWETRLDLFRVLLVGPTETPYANAPFVVDFSLPPSFPSVPPQVHFHSWPAHAAIGSIGRVNPNLYEDGKICLSLLGTWDGSKGEGWSASRSTLLQVIVSLLGLVLVRVPYFNEAGYETLVGTEANRRPSALYSERIYIRAKGFLITALSKLDSASGLKGLEDVVQWVYKDQKGPRLLEATIKDVEEVLQRSEDGTQEPDGLTVMSKGAAIPAKRLLDRLRELLAQ